MGESKKFYGMSCEEINYKNVGLGQYKNVGVFLHSYIVFSLHLL